MRTALVIGGTGMVGKQLVQLLLNENYFEKIILFGRRSLKIKNEKLVEHFINFDNVDSWKHLVTGDVLFSTLGTTIKEAGSQEAQYKIDFSYQLTFAKVAADNGIPVYVLVSSSGADTNSKIFYSRMKGELEVEVKKLPFKSINIFQPSLLVGKREKERFGEKAGYAILKAFNKIGFFTKYKPIEDIVVAQAMIYVAIGKEQGIKVYTLNEIFDIARSNG